MFQWHSQHLKSELCSYQPQQAVFLRLWEERNPTKVTYLITDRTRIHTWYLAPRNKRSPCVCGMQN